MRFSWTSLFVLSLLSGSCSVGTGPFAGKTCQTNLDCPAPYVCAQLGMGARTCEVLAGVDSFDPGSEQPAYYCNGPDGGGGAKHVLDKYCLANCHGTDMSYPGAPRSFRLDVYKTGTALQGAFEKALNVNARTQADTMPPVGLVGFPRPGPEDRTLLLRWVTAGAPECAAPDAGADGGAGTDGGAADGGTGTDAGSRTDGGVSADAGPTIDAGVDAGLRADGGAPDAG